MDDNWDCMIYRTPTIGETYEVYLGEHTRKTKWKYLGNGTWQDTKLKEHTRYDLWYKIN